MKRRLACFALALMLWAAAANAEIELGATEELALPARFLRTVHALEDGGFFLTGMSAGMAQEAEAFAALCMRIDPQANVLWQVSIPSEGLRTWFIDEALLSDGGIALIQQTEFKRMSDMAYKLIIVQAGEIVYQEALEPGDEQVMPQVHTARDGFFLFYGERRQQDRHRGTFHVPAVEYRSAQGALVWKHVFEDHEAAIRGALPVEGGHILYGTTEEQKTGNMYGEGFLAKADEAGNILWIQTSRDKGVRWRDYNGQGILLEDGGFVLTGELTMLTKGANYPSSGLLAQFDPEGNLVWQETYKLRDAEDYLVSNLTRVEEGYLMLGHEIGYQLPVDILLVDARGKLLETAQKAWDKNIEAIWTFLGNSAGGLRLIARAAPETGEGNMDAPRVLLITPIRCGQTE